MLAPSVALAQTRVQEEIVLTTSPVQFASFVIGDEVQSPAVQLGQSIYVPYVDKGGLSEPSCVKFYLLSAGDPVPDDSDQFLGVVVGQGNQRRYLWKGPIQPEASCIGTVLN